jgi:acetyl esterase/lipase
MRTPRVSERSFTWRNAGTLAVALLVLGSGVTAVRAGDTPPTGEATAAKAPAPAYEVRSVRDVAYYDGPDADPAKHKLDLFLPKGAKDFPVVVFVHGGAWHRGDKSYLGVYSSLGAFLARHGVGAAVINYRLSPAVRHPEHAHDVARAVAWMHGHIARYGGRPDELFLCGHSAGGHLVALLATDPAYLKAEGLKPDAVRGVIALSGVYDLAGLPERMLRSAFGTDPDVAEAASPVRHVRPGLPPFLLLYADRDLPGCDRRPAEAFARALRDRGVPAETHEIAHSSHHKIILSASVTGDPVSEALLAFVAPHAGKGPPPAAPAAAPAGRRSP